MWSVQISDRERMWVGQCGCVGGEVWIKSTSGAAFSETHAVRSVSKSSFPPPSSSPPRSRSSSYDAIAAANELARELAVGSLSPRQGLQTATLGVAFHTVTPAHKQPLTLLYFALARSLTQWHSRTQRTHAQPPSDFPNLQPLRLDQVTTTILSEQLCPHQWPDYDGMDATATADLSRNHTAHHRCWKLRRVEEPPPSSGDAHTTIVAMHSPTITAGAVLMFALTHTTAAAFAPRTFNAGLSGEGGSGHFLTQVCPASSARLHI
jgi:hypothetical protein